MFSRILAIIAISLIFINYTESAPAVSKARQFLPAVPGYVPVYIRSGDTPLEEINPDLAEAFDSYAQKHAKISFGRADTDGKIHVDVDNTHDISGVDNLSLEEQNEVVSVPAKQRFPYYQRKHPRV